MIRKLSIFAELDNNQTQNATARAASSARLFAADLIDIDPLIQMLIVFWSMGTCPDTELDNNLIRFMSKKRTARYLLEQPRMKSLLASIVMSCGTMPKKQEIAQRFRSGRVPSTSAVCVVWSRQVSAPPFQSG